MKDKKNQTREALRALWRHMILIERDRTLTTIAMFIWLLLGAVVYIWTNIIIYFMT